MANAKNRREKSTRFRRTPPSAAASVLGPEFQKVLESVPDAMVIVDRKSAIVTVNGHAEKLFRYTREELLGKSVELLVPERRIFQTRISDTKMPQPTPTTDGGNFTLYAVRKDGVEFPLEMRMGDLETKKGKFTVAILRDATDRQIAEGKLTIQLTALESAANGIVITDRVGMITWVNPAFSKLTGYTPLEAIGKRASLLKSGKHDRLFYENMWNTILSGQVWSGEMVNRRKDGQLYTEEQSITPVRDRLGKISHFIAIKQDITERKRAEDALRARDLAEAANRLKSEFLANMSHELRTPLNGIIGFAEMMHDGKLGPVSDQHKEYLGDILASSRHLLQLINDVLDLAKVEAGKMEFHPARVQLETVVKETCEIVRTMAAKKRLKIETAIDSKVSSVVLDPGKLKQLLYNYLSNAIKFTDDGGRITVRAAPQGAKEFRLEVEDTGIGIEPEDMGKLFREFQQLDSTLAKKYQGTGLGLALTKKMVEAQGGRVGVTSTLGKGSIFFAVLPRAPESVSTTNRSTLPKPAFIAKPCAPTILIIEDDADDQAWLTQLITGARYNVEVAGTGAKALSLCREKAFDGITLDLILPDMSGWDLLGKIRAQGRNSATPVIVVTLVPDKLAAVGYRVEEILTKPIVQSQLVSAMKRIGIAQGKSRKILCIDDNAGSLKLAETALRNAGYVPIAKTDARAAFKLLRDERPAAVILDLMMPGMDGFEFLERFRRMKDTHRIPIIVWTVKDLTPEDRRRLQSSVQAIVTKGPSGTAQLLEELAIHVGLTPIDAVLKNDGPVVIE